MDTNTWTIKTLPTPAFLFLTLDYTRGRGGLSERYHSKAVIGWESEVGDMLAPR